MTNDTTFDKIEAWLSGELLEAEARAFEEEMATDTALATEVARHRRGRDALDRLAEQALQTDITRWRASLDDLPEPPTDALPPTEGSNHLRRIIGGAFLILFIGAAYWFWPTEDIPPLTNDVPAINKPAQETSPVPIKPDVPMAVTPAKEPVKVIRPTKRIEHKNSTRLVAMAKTNLGDFRGAILQQYGQTMGDDDEENPFFTEGVKAFKEKKLKTAKKALLKVLKTDSFFPSAQEMLSSIYLGDKNYSKAVESYENYARQSADPAADWRLLQFYLADYDNHRADFFKILSGIADPVNKHRFQKEAEDLRQELDEMGENIRY